MLIPKQLITLIILFTVTSLNAAEFVPWQHTNFAIEKPLAGLVGDAAQGKMLATTKSKGNCLACHRLPIKHSEFHGTLGPTLLGIGSRLNAAQIRLRVVDEKQINPMTIMPGYHRDPKLLNRVREDFQGQAVLSAQEIEDIVAYLVTLK